MAAMIGSVLLLAAVMAAPALARATARRRPGAGPWDKNHR